jgi:hypothetical protein
VVRQGVIDSDSAVRASALVGGKSKCVASIAAEHATVSSPGGAPQAFVQAVLEIVAMGYRARWLVSTLGGGEM